MTTPEQARKFADVIGDNPIAFSDKYIAEALRDLANQVEALQADAERYQCLLSMFVGMKRADFFEPLRQWFYDHDEKYPDAGDVEVAIDAIRNAK